MQKYFLQNVLDGKATPCWFVEKRKSAVWKVGQSKIQDQDPVLCEYFKKNILKYFKDTQQIFRE